MKKSNFIYMSAGKSQVSELVRNCKCPFCNDWFHKDGIVNHRTACAKEKIARLESANARLRKTIAIVNVFLNRDYEDMGVAQFQDDLRDALKEGE